VERELVQRLAVKTERIDTIRALAGGVGATELRRAVLSDEAVAALCEGSADPNPQVRWWSIQLLDHVPDERALVAFAAALEDPVPRVRRNAAHALGCIACKPDWDGQLPADVLDRLASMAANDPNTKVRAEALASLSCHLKS
jgi:vesicle coat complex subunit